MTSASRQLALLSPPLAQATRELAALPVKGKQSEVAVCEVLWESADEVTMVASQGALRAVETVLRLRHGDREIVVDAAQPTVQMGRDAGHPIVIADRMASRLHGRIERRGERFYYIDVSTNGTHLAMEDDEETVLRRDQAMLRGRGPVGTRVLLELEALRAGGAGSDEHGCGERRADESCRLHLPVPSLPSARPRLPTGRRARAIVATCGSRPAGRPPAAARTLPAASARRSPARRPGR